MTTTIDISPTIAQCDELDDLVSEELRTELLSREQTAGRLRRLEDAHAALDTEVAEALDRGDVESAIANAARLVGCRQVLGQIEIRPIDPSVVRRAVGGPDSQLRQLGVDMALPDLDYRRDLVAFRALDPGSLRSVDPPRQTDSERSLIVRIESSDRDVSSWSENCKVWREVCEREPNQVLNLLTTAQSLLELGEQLAVDRQELSGLILAANSRRQREGLTWQPPGQRQPVQHPQFDQPQQPRDDSHSGGRLAGAPSAPVPAGAAIPPTSK